MALLARKGYQVAIGAKAIAESDEPMMLYVHDGTVSGQSSHLTGGWEDWIYVCDGIKPLYPAKHSFIFCSPSEYNKKPNQDHKQREVTTRYLPPWSWAELVDARDKFDIPPQLGITPQWLVSRVLRWGGMARAVFAWDDAQQDKEFRGGLLKLKEMSSTSQGEEKEAIRLARFVHMFPKDGTEFTEVAYGWCSEEVKLAAAAVFCELQDRQYTKFMNAATGSFYAASRGLAYEGHLLKLLVNGKTVLKPTGMPEINLQGFGGVFYSCKKTFMSMKVEPEHLYLPLSPNQPTWDAIAFKVKVGSKMYDALLVQCTVSSTHTISQEGFDWLKKKLRKRRLQILYCVVVPRSVMEFNFPKSTISDCEITNWWCQLDGVMKKPVVEEVPLTQPPENLRL